MLKSVITHFQKMVLSIMLWLTYCFRDITVWNRRILLNSCWVTIIFDILIANIWWAVAQTPINHIIFWKIVMRTFKCIYVNCLNRLRFLTEVSTKLQKMHFFGQFKENAQNTEKTQNSFSCDPLFVLFWSIKYLNFGQSYRFEQPIILF